jgi:hypothetical protein
MSSTGHLPSLEDGAVRWRSPRAPAGGRRAVRPAGPADGHVPGTGIRAARSGLASGGTCASGCFTWR